ncbi:hypothetical protein D477_013350 [Arthrobacter crystallopoietes BAB-32]|uniref:Alkaline shock response membrane anchor protein AmaP n=1 Tax=Arthrobacter crystallopoietes BAB-32 TaxID=1246476 RepID=N1UXE2_9MICC|nr:hypothetical protein [Arthrobacter crystallopoietes]EMY33715.1 hypothetical protein D477_013350 [Arthrobacter crystallopoietes BAB-32]
MNQTPRGLNRLLLAVIGLVLLATGVLALGLAAFPGLAGWWRRTTQGAGTAVENLLAATTLPGQRDSWLWIVLALLMLLVVLAMITWIAQQGKGRAGTLAADDVDDGGPGMVSLSGAAAEQALKAALAEREDILHVTVATYEYRGTPGLKVRVLPRKGVAPQDLAEDISAQVEALDLVLGRRIPVVVSIGASARSRLGRGDRVH